MSIEITESQFLRDFNEVWRSIPSFSGCVRIGDFTLNGAHDQKIIADAKVGFGVYGVASIDELRVDSKQIYIAIPALTGNAKIFAEKSSQGSGWANPYGVKDGILDPEKAIIIGLDYFGGPYDSSGPDRHNLDFYPVPPAKQVEAWKRALKILGIQAVDTLFGGSNGGGHIHHWLFSDQYAPNTLIPIAWPVFPEPDAREFFSLQVDFIKKRNDVSERVRANVERLLWRNSLYDYFVDFVIEAVRRVANEWNPSDAIHVARWIGFLKFVNPEFFDRFRRDKVGQLLGDIQAQENMIQYFQNEGMRFEERFGLSSLALLCEGIADAPTITPVEYVEKISQAVCLTVVGFAHDELFDAEKIRAYFDAVAVLRRKRWDAGTTIIHILSDSAFLQPGHDAFLWPERIPEITRAIQE